MIYDVTMACDDNLGLTQKKKTNKAAENAHCDGSPALIFLVSNPKWMDTTAACEVANQSLKKKKKL